MILLDTSVWIDHLGAGEPTVARLLEDGQVLCHLWVVGELSLGRLSRRHEVLGLLRNLPQASVATYAEVAALIEGRTLYGRGLGFVDAHLLAGTLLTADARLWTRDKRLGAAAAELGCAAVPDHHA